MQNYGYAVLEQSESLGISSLDHRVFLSPASALEHAAWCADHLTGSYADAGDTTCSVVALELSREQYANLVEELDAGLVG